MPLRAPFPWFGGKSRAAALIWARFGDVSNYVEPFAGSLAVLLGRPHAPQTETVNDADCYLVNFWRAVRAEPDTVAKWADWPVSEADLLARHRWLVETGAARVGRLRTDPDFFDAKIAGWWVWGLCAWIGSGWCRERGDGHQPEQIPHLGDAGRGINRKLPHLGDAGRGLADYFAALSDRLRKVRLCAGDWTRVLGESVTVKHGVTAILLDPPYASDDHDVTYSTETGDVSADVHAWALEHGNNPNLRLALCGYDAGQPTPEGWTAVRWKARGGYGSQADGRGRSNATRERIWFSPHCLGSHATTPLFAGGVA